MPSLALVKAGAIALALAALFYFGYSQGSDHVQSQWDRERAELNSQAAQKITEAYERVRATEQAASKRVAFAEQSYSKKLREKSNEESTALVRARTNGLFIDAKCPNNSDSVSGVTAVAADGHGEARVELPRTAGEFLISLAAEADRVTEQLSACQAILKSERVQ